MKKAEGDMWGAYLLSDISSLTTAEDSFFFFPRLAITTEREGLVVVKIRRCRITHTWLNPK